MRQGRDGPITRDSGSKRLQCSLGPCACANSPSFLIKTISGGFPTIWLVSNASRFSARDPTDLPISGRFERCYPSNNESSSNHLVPEPTILSISVVGWLAKIPYNKYRILIQYFSLLVYRDHRVGLTQFSRMFSRSLSLYPDHSAYPFRQVNIFALSMMSENGQCKVRCSCRHQIPTWYVRIQIFAS